MPKSLRISKAMDDIKAKLAVRRAAREATELVAPISRYDEVYWQGLSWLEALAERIDLGHGIACHIGRRSDAALSPTRTEGDWESDTDD